MKRLFLHNLYDRESRELLQQIKSDPILAENTEIIDYFGDTSSEWISKIIPVSLPCFISKQFIMLEPRSTFVSVTGNILEVKIGCFNLDGSPADVNTEIEKVFNVFVNEDLYSAKPVQEQTSTGIMPVLILRFSIVPGVVINLRVEANEYLPFSASLKVVD